jgi:hypothetical protein
MITGCPGRWTYRLRKRIPPRDKDERVNAKSVQPPTRVRSRFPPRHSKRLRPTPSERPLKRVSARANGQQAEPSASHFQRLEGAGRRRGPGTPLTARHLRNPRELSKPAHRRQMHCGRIMSDSGTTSSRSTSPKSSKPLMSVGVGVDFVVGLGVDLDVGPDVVRPGVIDRSAHGLWVT